jgi:hypothetical protein
MLMMAKILHMSIQTNCIRLRNNRKIKYFPFSDYHFQFIIQPTKGKMKRERREEQKVGHRKDRKVDDKFMTPLREVALNIEGKRKCLRKEWPNSLTNSSRDNSGRMQFISLPLVLIRKNNFEHI